MSYILNSKSRTVHNGSSRDVRCHLEKIEEENRFEFEKLEEALSYLPHAVLCRFCLGKEEER